MCDVARRNLLLAGAVAAVANKGAAQQSGVNQVDTIIGDVYFHVGDIEGRGHCNNGWIVFNDYVLVIDANFPSGAHTIIPKIRAITQKPIRFAFDTHHHGDHAYGNQVWIENGATPVAHTGVIDEMKRYETGYYGGKPGRWEDTAKSRPDVASSRLAPPSVLFPRELYFDDGKHRVELMHLGVAHTHGDAFAWLPNERILFTGDACVNGAYNYAGDGNVSKWIATLDAAKKLGARVVCPGHGPRGDAGLLDDQQAFFKQLVTHVDKLVRAKTDPREIYKSIESLRSGLTSDSRIARYAGKGLAAQVEKVYHELTGSKFPDDVKASKSARLRHARDHSLELV
jgi:glyoxylase-like metal-dependent hydrolase (beta-lactamase superfamily II)